MEIEKKENHSKPKIISKNNNQVKRAQKNRLRKNKHKQALKKIERNKIIIERQNDLNYYEKHILNINEKLELLKNKFAEDLAFHIITIFREDNKDLIKKIVKYYPQPKIIEFIEQTTEEMKIKNDKKGEDYQRTIGGIFIKLVKSDLLQNDAMNYKEVFSRPIEKVRKRNQMKSRRRKERKTLTKKIAGPLPSEKIKTKNMFDVFNQ